ncbi:VanZ family protein [Puniceibacterium confluentis]|uniref:VanZ family protein n=1 Tax=Puniceibacterium confluentis TaxID=1958944 RepID=UPI0011B6445D|nr:VanZ family protein [Puniceibacterium confluentis]
MGAWVLGFGGLALLYGGIASLVLLGLARLGGRFPGWRALPFLFSTLTFVFLTQHPFPDPATMSCPVPGATPQLIPMHFLETFARLERRGAGWLEMVRNRTLAAAAMNFLLCGVIGMTLAAHASRLRTAALFGVLLTLSVELTQLTGFWGLWPCAWRQFDVDDLLLNAPGVIAGFALARALWWRRRAP